MARDFLIAVMGAFLLDRSGFWYLQNTASQFSGRDLSFTYYRTLFPRVLLILLACSLVAFGKHSDSHSDLLVIAGLVCFIASHGYLYVKAFRRRVGPH